ncbi:hypothetical protein A3C59_03020 [Candidatus Daviesbacteria bacterium RIFCSPHIGHO2_02_FULL_36_13]|uniref:Uncharacterized protein n=1 Tax=Candidatus Daviesbacteria bacterium RIFCSPHIGHO2_02_FULL_36_13 TaxID=1797768 RepID=A0A1F5JQF6_9BACT|nr:MAG: hypothetical protein A3C59_03020 [Candidatus Daviesbacteria bacterium RIFCSPHIGHO2_02_FULL_36_13]
MVERIRNLNLPKRAWNLVVPENFPGVLIFPKAGFNAVAIYAAEQVLTHPLPVSRFYFGMVVMASLYAEWSIRREAARMNQNG